MAKASSSVNIRKLWLKQAVNLVQAARTQVLRQTNSLMVFTYFHLGKLIIEQEQKGKLKAAYGIQMLKQLSTTLTKQFGKGFSEDNLSHMRSFYLQYGSKFQGFQISETVSRKSEHFEIGNCTLYLQKMFCNSENCTARYKVIAYFDSCLLHFTKAFNAVLLGKNNLYSFAKMVLLSVGNVISTTVSLLSLQMMIPSVGFS